MTKLMVRVTAADIDETEVRVGDTCFWVGREVHSAYLDGDDEPLHIEDACSRLGFDAEDLADVVHSIGWHPCGYIDSCCTPEHLAELFGCDAVVDVCDNCGQGGPAWTTPAGRFCDLACGEAYELL